MVFVETPKIATKQFTIGSMQKVTVNTAETPYKRKRKGSNKECLENFIKEPFYYLIFKNIGATDT